MATYRFSHFMVNGTRMEGPTLTLTNISVDTTIQAVYVQVIKISYNSTPISADSKINTATVKSGETVVVDKGSTVNVIVPAEMTV